MGAPTSTYRLQLRPGFALAEAAGLADYLVALGVSHVYLSPVLQAMPGSTHGYDVVDHSRLSADLGGDEGWSRLREALRAYGLRAVVDVVPNHACVAAPEHLNAAFWSVLHQGRGSPFARWFDIDWDAQGGRVLVPVLGAPVGECLDQLVVDGDVLRYHDHVFPLAPGTEALPLPELLDAQHYRLAYWRVGAEELNYRRFFDIMSLAGLRVEDPVVFGATHERLVRLVRDGDVDGLRIDHPDGLADPKGYLDRLSEAAGRRWVVVEKILAADEELPRDWACAGTTGYDALHAVGGLFVDPRGERPLTDLHTSLTGAPDRFAEVATAARRAVVRDTLAAELNRVTDALTEVCAADILLRDHTRRALREALEELLVAFPVYRAYMRPGEPPSDATRRYVEEAVRTARERLPRRSGEIDVVADLALGRLGRGPRRDEVAVRFQQVCGSIMAKGVEDTAFYRWSRLVSLCDVGGDPDRFGVPTCDFHGFCARLQRDWPETMTALSTHDTKRSEDVRARLAVLSEVPSEWGRAVTTWRAAAVEKFGHGPDPGVEYLFWQTLVGAWPLPEERMTAYLAKAVREAKLATSWTDPDRAYEAAVRAYVAAVYADDRIIGDVTRFAERIAPYGRRNALAQKLIQLTMPGVPDVYQGTELWDLSLVDPDNRRPVDFTARRALLAGVDGCSGVPAVDATGAAKLLVVSRALRLRRRHPEWFGSSATYEPMHATGPAAGHVIAFARSGGAVTVATRLPVGLERSGGWRDTCLPLAEGSWRDALTGRPYAGAVRLADLLDGLPVALLTRAAA